MFPERFFRYLLERFFSSVEVTIFYRFPYVFVAFAWGSEVQGNPHPTQRQCAVDLEVVHKLRRYALVPSKTPRKVILFAHKWHSVRDVYQLAGPNLASFPTSGGSAPPTFFVRFPNVFGTFFYTPGNVFLGARLNVFLPFSSSGAFSKKTLKKPSQRFILS